ncbi:MAG: 5-formyltetrahydrofolate cyclo-ligase [Lachnospiraceae bacterium]|nr:5-formyltetrahydrofolate cyclo-ligase [Lachnospiraceae bacterium]
MVENLKQQLRTKIKKQIAMLSPQYCAEMDRRIQQKVFSLPVFQNSKTILCYAGMGKEINTRPILQEILAQNKILGIPKVNGKGHMEVYQVSDLAKLALGKYGILEPKCTSSPLQPDTIDLAIVPGLTFTKDGKRLGYGGGYFDRYLAQRDMITLALCRSVLLQEDIPVENYDIRMDIVLTEKG